MLLLEAGGRDRSLKIKIPAAFPEQFHTKLDWDYATEPEPHVDGRALYIPRGKSARRLELDERDALRARTAARLRRLGGAGRARAGAIATCCRTSCAPRTTCAGASEFHGAGGPLRVSEQRSPRPMNARLLAASEAAGIPRIADYNGPEQDGVSMFQVTQRNGRRFSAADAFLRPAMTRPNLEVRTERRPCSASSSTASAPSACASRTRPARRGARAAEREVILSAGAIGSPQLLLLSGIGAGRGAARGGRRGRATSCRGSGATCRTTRS